MYELRHVTGESRRLKVYQLTPLGRSLAMDLKRRASALESGVNGPSTDGEV